MISAITFSLCSCISLAFGFAFAVSTTDGSTTITSVGGITETTQGLSGSTSSPTEDGMSSSIGTTDVNTILSTTRESTTPATSEESNTMSSISSTESLITTSVDDNTISSSTGGNVTSEPPTAATSQESNTMFSISNTESATTTSTDESSTAAPPSQTSSVLPTESSPSVTSATNINVTPESSIATLIDKTDDVNSTSSTHTATSAGTSTPSTSLPIGGVTAPPITQTVSLNFEIVYNTSGEPSKRKRRWTSRRLLQKNEYDKFQENLEELYQNETAGFLSLRLDEGPNDKCSTVMYTLFYDGAVLAAACTSGGCQLQSQIENNVLDEIGDAGAFGACTVDITATQSKMNVTLQSSETLGNPCVMSPNLCGSLGKQYTCKYEETNLYCQDVCINFCDGGECYADHDHTGQDGEPACKCPEYTYLDADNNCHDRCPTFNFLADDDRCYSWWIILGPLIGVAVIAILLIVVLVMCRRRPTRDEQKQKMLSTSGNEIENPAYVFSDHNVDESKCSELKIEDPQTTTFKEELKSFGDEAGTTAPGADEPDVRVAEESNQTNILGSGEPRADEPDANRDQTNARSNMNGAAPRGRRQDDLQDFATMTSQQLADHPDFRDFQPQLDKVDTTIQCIIKRPHINDQATKRPSSSRYEEDSNGRASYIRDERDRI